MTSRHCDGCSFVPSGAPRPRRKKTKFGRQTYRQCGLPSRQMSREGEPGGYKRRSSASHKVGRGQGGDQLALATMNSSLYCNKPSAIHQTRRSRVLHRKVART